MNYQQEKVVNPTVKQNLYQILYTARLTVWNSNRSAGEGKQSDDLAAFLESSDIVIYYTLGITLHLL